MEKKDINLLTEEDKFLMQLTKVERLATKLSIMSFMGNFLDNLHLISPVSIYIYYISITPVKLIQFLILITASTCNYISVKFSKKL